VVSAAERLCDPVKRGPHQYAHLKVDELLRAGRLAEINLTCLETARLGISKGELGRVNLGLLGLGRPGQVDSCPGGVGNEGFLQGATLQTRELTWTYSPTQVTQVMEIERSRQPVVLSGPLEEQAARVTEFIRAILGGSAEPEGTQELEPWVMEPRNPLPRLPEEKPSCEQARSLARLPVLDAMLIPEPGRPELDSALLEACKGLARNRSLHTTVARLGSAGIDSAGIDEEACASTVLAYIQQARAGKKPQIILAPNSSFGTALLARLGAALGMGVIADAVSLEHDEEGIIAWKPALSGGVMAGIKSKSPIFIATFMASPSTSRITTEPERNWDGTSGPMQLLTVQLAVKKGVSSKRILETDPVSGELASAKVVVGVGSGVGPEGYQQVDELVQLLGGVLVATRKVTDRGWLPRTRQVGLTGQAIAPDLYVVIGASGKLNHMIGARGAKAIVAINNDPEAPVFKACDLGMVAEWTEATKALIKALHSTTR
jgi:electron transfer flavoprotein alpha subunit